MNTYDYKKKKPVKVGDIVGDTFIKKCKPNHYFRMLDAYGIQEEAIQSLKKSGKINTIRLIIDKKSYDTKLDDWFSPEIKVMDYGHGKQRFFPKRYLV